MSEHVPRDIAIVGVGALFPGYENAQQFWRSIVSAPHAALESQIRPKSVGGEFEAPSGAGNDSTFALIVAHQVLDDACAQTGGT